MQIEFSPEEVQNLILLLNRVQLTGAEALAVTLLIQKLAQAAQSTLGTSLEAKKKPE